jgi:hypothetical protein
MMRSSLPLSPSERESRRSRRRRAAGWRRLTLGVAAAIAFIVAGAHTAGADTTALAASAQAWYTTTAPCTTPVLPGGCPAANPYPAGTLHVAVSGGQTTAVSTLVFDLSALPTGASVTSATLTLTLDPNAVDGAANATAARLAVCSLAAPFTPGEGSTTPPPACAGSAASATVSPTGATASADVTNAAAAWAAGSPNNGFRIQPAAGAAPTDAWHAVLMGRGATAGAPELSVTFTAAANGRGSVGNSVTTPPPGSSSSGSFVELPTPASSSAAVLAPAPVAEAPPSVADTTGRRLAPSVVAPPGAAAAAPTARRIGPARYAYPAVFFLPPVLLLGIAAAGRVLTKEMVVPPG